MLLRKTNSPGVDLILPDFHYRDRLRRHRRGRAHARPRGPHRRGALPAARAARHPADRLAAHARAGRVQARPAPDPARDAARGRGRDDVGRAVGARVLRGQPLDPGRARRGDPRRAATVLHTGDFKMDQPPLDGRLTDLAGFARLGDEGVDLLLADSTNAEVPGFVPSERDIGPVVADVIAKARGGSSWPASPRTCTGCSRCWTRRPNPAATSPSSAARWCATWASPATSATAGARRLAGRSARDRADPVAPGAADLHRLAGRAAVGAVADGQPRAPDRRRRADDTVVLASSLIPGNENSVGEVINGLTRLGATVVHKSTALVHVSGHAPAGELLYLLNAVRPKNHMPVHGEWRHLRAHAAIARSTGVPDERIMLAEDGIGGRSGRRPGHRSSARSRSATSTSTGSRSATSATPCSRTGASSAKRASSRSSSPSTCRPARSSTARSCPRADSPATTAPLDPLRAELIAAVEQAVADGQTDVHALEHTVRRLAGRWVDRTLPPPPDADPDGRRGLMRHGAH